MNQKRANYKSIAFLSLLILSLVSFSLMTPFAMATDDDADGIEDEDEALNIRTISIENSTNQMEITSTLRTEGAKDKIEIKIKYDTSGLEFEVGYERESGEDVTIFEVEFSVTFIKLIEFEDVNTNGIFDKSSDTNHKELDLNAFNTPIYTTQTLSASTKLHNIEVSTTDGNFTALIHVVEEYAKVNGTLITPTEVKIDIIIEGFDYTTGTSLLALYAKLESGGDYIDDDETEDEVHGHITGEDSVKITNTSSGYTGFFSWAETADVDGTTKAIKTSAIAADDDDPNEQKLYINYPQGAKIIHDPKIGIAGIEQTPLNWFLIILIGSVAAVGVVAVILIVKKVRAD